MLNPILNQCFYEKVHAKFSRGCPEYKLHKCLQLPNYEHIYDEHTLFVCIALVQLFGWMSKKDKYWKVSFYNTLKETQNDWVAAYTPDKFCLVTRLRLAKFFLTWQLLFRNLWAICLLLHSPPMAGRVYGLMDSPSWNMWCRQAQIRQLKVPEAVPKSRRERCKFPKASHQKLTLVLPLGYTVQ